MKRISYLLVAALLAMPVVLRAQDPAVEERLNKISAQIQDLIDAKDAQNKRIEELARQLRVLQDQQNKPNATFATQDDLKQLAAKLQEIDQKRKEDSELIRNQLVSLGKTLSTTTRASAPPAAGDTRSSAATDRGHYEYVIESGDTLTAIAAAYKDKGIKISVDDILKANPGLKPERMSVGQKIIIPAPGH